MSSTPAAGTQPSTIYKYRPTFLGLPAELPNTIYEYAFAAEPKHSLTPHALIRTCQQTRGEAHAMYYASVTDLDIPLLTIQDIARATRWLAEADFSMYPVLPAFVFSFKQHIGQGTMEVVKICCTRETVVPADDIGRIKAPYRETLPESSDEEIDYDAHTNVYYKCLGVRDDHHASLGLFDMDFLAMEQPVSRTFMESVDTGSLWVTRQLAYDKEKASGDVLDMFLDLAVYNQGLE